MDSEPIELFRQAVDALNREDWMRLALLCEPASLDDFKSELVDSLSSGSDQASLTAIELMKAVPTMPRAVAEYQLARFRENLDPKRRLREEVPTVPTVAALKEMQPVEVFAAWLEGRSHRRQIERNVEMKRMSRAQANEIVAEGLHRFAFTPIGFVKDGRNAGFVVYRRDAGGPRPSTDVMRKTADGWRLVADRYLLMMHQAEVAAVEDEQPV
jgi:hypothetical protein